MKHLNITTFNGLINNQSTQLINARELHELLQVTTPFHKWIARRISDYEFTENLDFTEGTTLSARGFFKTEVKEYHITLDMAKELCMLERTELGRKARRHFIKMEQHALSEIPRLTAKVQELEGELRCIPNFVRQTPEPFLRLIEQAQEAYLTTNPQAKEIIRYREMGLTYDEMAKLLGKTKNSVQWMVRRMIKLGFLESKKKNQAENQLPLFA
ncbi:antA/AntB antirepressor family protein [Phocoenobacter skyensis]|uniref:AntA/AntB antirepressor family protein n=1 Tax=Phocoenobacter skyensis TaxID=97481 RepID=A0ABT9JL79_9PAST|nr:antA/AntB antirepressor family protein [Pasteurella skyensis]MDP8079535.1 antA/AntB antirepressor family protein [Pasteurella skyensis]MDP8085407.1 antA/AntB antirepressor family protein [Pasteurella skyensis]